MLMPSLRGVVVHDGYSNLVWSSDDSDLSDEPEVINDTIANALSDRGEFPGAAKTLDADRVVYSFAIRGEHIELLGIVSLVVRLAGTKIEPRPLPAVRQLVQAALECMRRELALRAKISSTERALRPKLGSSERDLNVKERDLELMMEISSNQTAGSDADEFSQILKTGLDRMGCALAALWVPDKNVSVSMTRSGTPMSTDALQRAQLHLTAWMQMQQRTIVINHISKVATDVAAPYKILACPIRHTSGRVMGVLALFNPPSAQDFDLQQTRVAEMLAKRSTNIIQAQYDTSTGLMTRQAFERHVGNLLAGGMAAGAHIILYLDIDRLHVINETFGMHVGDDVIVSVADRMAKTLPAEALSARISGDRLAALIPNSSMESAAAIAEQIRAAAEGIVPRAGQGAFEVSVCLGVAPIGRSDNPLAHALATAEIACKAAKDRGRNRVEIFQDSDQSIIRRHTDILVIGKLREALGNDSFRLDAQPILPLRGNYGRARF